MGGCWEMALKYGRNPVKTGLLADCSTVRFAPSFYHVLPKQSKPPAEAKITDMTPQREPAGPTTAVTPNTTQKKKRRKSRWSAGVYAKKKSSSSPYMSRDDTHLGTDEEEEDGDDEEEEVEKGGGAECDERTVRVEDQMVPAQEGSFGPTVKEQDSQERREERSQAAKDKVILCEIRKPENKEKMDKAVTDQPGQSEESNKVLTKAGNENSETISVNTNKDSHTKTEGDTQGQSNTEESGETNSEMLRETETDKCQTVMQADDQNNKVVTVGEAEQNSHAEPMEVEATETSTTDASAVVRGEEDTGTERGVRRMTRALKNAVLQQQMIDVDKALQILDKETPPLVVDRDKLKELLERAVIKTEGYEVYKLEKLYALLCQSIYRHRRDYNKTALLQELEQEIEDFC